MSDDESMDAIPEAPIDERIVEEVAADADVAAEELANALVVLDSELRGYHSTFEERKYTTVDGRRAYIVSPADWEQFATDVEFGDDDVLDAVEAAHTRQATLLFDAAVESARFNEDQLGVVIGIDTAEQMV